MLPVCHAFPMIDDLLDANRRYVDGFELAGIPARAAKEFALVTCMDSRIEPLTMLGLRPGDAKIVRNAGGRVTSDVLRSLILATHFLGVRRIAVMQHTDCALADRTDDDIRSDLADQRSGSGRRLGVPDHARPGAGPAGGRRARCAPASCCRRGSWWRDGGTTSRRGDRRADRAR